METDQELLGRLKLEPDLDRWTFGAATGKELDALARLVGINRLKGEESMAKLSERTTTVSTVPTNAIPATSLATHTHSQFKGETNMTTNNTGTLRVLNLMLVDNNHNLKVEGKVVFQKLSHMTEHNDERTIQQILMSGEVAESLEAHNIKRVKVVDKDIQRATGRDVKLEEVEIFDLDWQVVRVA